MRIKLATVRVHKDAGIITLDKSVPLYEASLLRLVHGADLVDILTPDNGKTRTVESAQDEYRRLGDLYGKDKERNAKRVELIFGFFETGQFDKAFGDSVVTNDAEVFTKKDGSAFKREADLMNALAKDGVEGQYAATQVEDGFIGSPS